MRSSCVRQRFSARAQCSSSRLSNTLSLLTCFGIVSSATAERSQGLLLKISYSCFFHVLKAFSLEAVFLTVNMSLLNRRRLPEPVI
jgi:hypothetical protein